MAAGLQAIQDNYEGRIWKGFHNGVMYIDSELHSEAAKTFNIETFMIVNALPIPFFNPKEPWKYTDGYGCHFILTKAAVPNLPVPNLQNSFSW